MYKLDSKTVSMCRKEMQYYQDKYKRDDSGCYEIYNNGEYVFFRDGKPQFSVRTEIIDNNTEYYIIRWVQ